MPYVEVTKVCPLCDKPSKVVVDRDKYNEYLVGLLKRKPAATHSVQAIFPDLSAGERETLISGCHEECFDKAFPDD